MISCIRDTKNIGMRVDLGKTATDDNSGTLTPEAVNKRKITITDWNREYRDGCQSE